MLSASSQFQSPYRLEDVPLMSSDERQALLVPPSSDNSPNRRRSQSDSDIGSHSSGGVPSPASSQGSTRGSSLTRSRRVTESFGSFIQRGVSYLTTPPPSSRPTRAESRTTPSAVDFLTSHFPASSPTIPDPNDPSLSGPIPTTTASATKKKQQVMANAPTAAQTASGFAINIINTANTAFEGSHVHSKKERANLDAHQRSLLFEQATTKLPNGVKFVPLPATINDPKQLSTFSSVDSTIQVFVERLQAFDLRDVFYLLTVLDMNNHKAEEEEDPNNPGVKRLKMIDLLTDYANVSVAQVATSNQFYHLWTDNAVDQMHTNLNWSYYLLKNNIDPLLMSRLQPKYDAFPVSQRGGPLLFALLMAELLYTNESAVQTLKDQIEKYKINKVPGEDIKKIS